MVLVGVAPCQCFWPGGIHTTSPCRISCVGPPHSCTQPVPAVTISVWPSGCVCHAVRAPGSNVTRPPDVRDGAVALNKGSMRTEPVKLSAGPLLEGCEPLRVMLIACESSVEATGPEAALPWFARMDAQASRESDITVAVSSFISVLPIQ